MPRVSWHSSKASRKNKQVACKRSLHRLPVRVLQESGCVGSRLRDPLCTPVQFWPVQSGPGRFYPGQFCPGQFCPGPGRGVCWLNLDFKISFSKSRFQKFIGKRLAQAGAGMMKTTACRIDGGSGGPDQGHLSRESPFFRRAPGHPGIDVPGSGAGFPGAPVPRQQTAWNCSWKT